jgi:hypothetical protein
LPYPATVRLATNQRIRIPADLRHNRLMLPGRVADEVLELLRTAVLNHVGHPGKSAIAGLRQALQIPPGHRRIVAGSRAEETGVALDQRRKRLGDRLDG